MSSGNGNSENGKRRAYSHPIFARNTKINDADDYEEVPVFEFLDAFIMKAHLFSPVNFFWLLQLRIIVFNRHGNIEVLTGIQSSDSTFCIPSTMGSYMNFKNFRDTAQLDGSGGKPAGIYPSSRQSSIYSLTFDEFQSTLGGPGKDFGSMNKEDLLKSIWTTEESQDVASSTGGGDGSVPGGNLQRQGSITLPCTLTQKTVDEVYRDVLKETIGRNSESDGGDSSLGPRQPTLGEMTFEEFLSLAGVAREAARLYCGLPPSSGNNTAVTIGHQRPSQNHDLLGNQLVLPNNIVLNSPNIGLDMSSVPSTQQQHQHPRPQLQPLFPKQTTLAFFSPTQPGNCRLSSPGAKGPMMEMKNASSTTRVQGGPLVMDGLTNGAALAGGSPRNSIYANAIGKKITETPSLLASPCNFGETEQGWRSSSSLEKVVERRQRRMIKNRESAARSRARKQVYTLELEAEVAKLKERNQELQKKQEEFVKMQKNQILEIKNKSWGDKRRCLRRTSTGPW